MDFFPMIKPSDPDHDSANPHFPAGLALIRLALLASILTFMTAVLAMADPFSEAIICYEKEEFSSALKHFEAAIANQETAAARHNLALTHFQLGQPALAAWQIERAARIAPFNAEYQYKLGALRNQLGLFDNQAKWYQLVAEALSLSKWILLACVSAWLALASLTLPKLAGRSSNLGLKTLQALSLIVLLLSIPASILQHRARQQGIVIADKTTALHAAPATAAPESGNARPGERAHLIDQHNDFLKITTEGQATGWIKQDAFRKLIN